LPTNGQDYSLANARGKCKTATNRVAVFCYIGQKACWWLVIISTNLLIVISA